MRRAHAAVSPAAAPEFEIPETVAQVELNPMAQDAGMSGDNPLAEGVGFGEGNEV